MRGERIAAPIFALLIVFSGAGASIAPGVSPVGTAEAQLAEGNCTFEDALLEGLTFGTLYEDNCGDVKELSEEWNETDADQTRTQIHSQAGQLAAGNEQFLTVQRNLLTDSNTIAFSKGEAAAVEVLANNGTVAEAQSAANESIEDYYTVKQINLIDRWNVNIETLRTLDARAENTTGVDRDFVTLGNKSSNLGTFESDPDSPYTLTEMGLNSDGSISTSQTVLNGTQTTVYQIEPIVYDASGGSDIATPGSFIDGSIYRNIRGNGPSSWSGDYDRVNATHIRVRPTDNLSSKKISMVEMWSTYKEIEQTSQSTKQEVSVYIEESLGPAVQNGELNATSYVSPATLAQEYAQEYGNDSSYIRATAIAAYSGMDAPDLEETGSMTITYDGTTYEGLLLSQEAPSGGWQSGETYDPALLSGLQMFAVAGENSSVVELDGAFSVEKVTGTDGQEIDKATTVNVTYETSNASANYSELQQQIRSLNEQIEERQAQATAGGSEVQTNDGLLAKIAAALGVGTGVILVGAAAVVVIVAKVYLPDQ